MRKTLFVALLALIVLSIGLALMRPGEWVIPEEQARRENPLLPSAKDLEAARGVYKENCAECHGDTGKGDGPKGRKLFTDPSDLTNATRMGSLTDGAIFYEISEGRRPMPSFMTRMTEEQRWQLVLLMRSFSGSGTIGKKNP
ncbi:MAG: cytochrome c [Acidobacteriota bacterium]|nr:cytochrome c [Acidobacteriota bacterium]